MKLSLFQFKFQFPLTNISLLKSVIVDNVTNKVTNFNNDSLLKLVTSSQALEKEKSRKFELS